MSVRGVRICERAHRSLPGWLVPTGPNRRGAKSLPGRPPLSKACSDRLTGSPNPDTRTVPALIRPGPDGPGATRRPGPGLSGLVVEASERRGGTAGRTARTVRICPVRYQSRQTRVIVGSRPVRDGCRSSRGVPAPGAGVPLVRAAPDMKGRLSAGTESRPPSSRTPTGPGALWRSIRALSRSSCAARASRHVTPRRIPPPPPPRRARRLSRTLRARRRTCPSPVRAFPARAYPVCRAKPVATRCAVRLA